MKKYNSYLDYFHECGIQLAKCKQFNELWNIVQEKDVISKCLNRKPIPKAIFLNNILMNRLNILDRIEKYLGMEFNEVRKLTIPYLEENNLIEIKEEDNK